MRLRPVMGWPVPGRDPPVVDLPQAWATIPPRSIARHPTLHRPVRPGHCLDQEPLDRGDPAYGLGGQEQHQPFSVADLQVLGSYVCKLVLAESGHARAPHHPVAESGEGVLAAETDDALAPKSVIRGG